MASEIERALSGIAGYQSGQQSDTGISSFQYQPATIELNKPQPSTLHAVFDEILKSGSTIAKAKDQINQNTAEEDYRVKMAKLSKGDITQEDFNNWVNQGDMWYKDNPYARSYARKAIGLNARHEVDNNIATDIEKDKYKTREELADAMRIRRREAVDNMAKLYGIDANDHDFLAGVGNGLVESDVALHEKWSQFKSTQQINTDQNIAYAHVSELVSTPAGMDTKAHAKSIATVLNGGMKNGVFFNPADQITYVKHALDQAQHQPNGGELVTALGEENVELNGVTVKIKDLMGSNAMQTAQLTGDQSTTRLNNTLSTKMRDELAVIEAEDDPQKSRIMLQQWHEKYSPYISSQGEETEWTRAEQGIRDGFQTKEKKLLASSLAGKEYEEKRGRGDAAMHQAFETASKTPDGKLIVGNIPWDEKTMGNRDEAYRAEIQRRINTVEDDFTSGKISEDDKNQRMLALYSIDERNTSGTMKTQMDSVADGAAGEYAALVATGDVTADHPQMDKLMSMYKTNPLAVRRMLARNKDADQMLTNIDILNSTHFKLSDLINSQHNLNLMDPVAKKNLDTNFSGSKLFTDPNFTAPPSIMFNARQIFSLVYSNKQDSSAAEKAASDYVRNSTTKMVASGFKNKTLGYMPTQNLMVGNDPKSVDVVHNYIVDWTRDNFKDLDNVSIYPDAATNGIIVEDINTGSAHRFTRENLEKAYNDKVAESKAAEAKAHDEAIKRLRGEVVQQEAHQEKMARESSQVIPTGPRF